MFFDQPAKIPINPAKTKYIIIFKFLFIKINKNTKAIKNLWSMFKKTKPPSTNNKVFNISKKIAIKNPITTGCKPFKTALTYLFSLNFPKIFATTTTTINDGATKLNVETTAPGNPAALYPAYVAMLTPTGPGVASAIAIMSTIKSLLNQLYLSAISYKNGIVAIPPPKENSPILKNSKNNQKYIINLNFRSIF